MSPMHPTYADTRLTWTREFVFDLQQFKMSFSPFLKPPRAQRHKPVVSVSSRGDRWSSRPSRKPTAVETHARFYSRTHTFLWGQLSSSRFPGDVSSISEKLNFIDKVADDGQQRRTSHGSKSVCPLSSCLFLSLLLFCNIFSLLHKFEIRQPIKTSLYK